MDRMEGKVAIVTGAASKDGLGYATARAFVLQGAKVVITDLNAVDIKARAADLNADENCALALPHDVTREDDWQRVIAQTVGAFGKVNVLVNNAGITLRDDIDKMDLEVWKRVIEVNQTGTFLGCKHAVASMRKAGEAGSIINVSSIAGLIGVRYSGAYGASKGAIRQLTKVVAIEGAKEGIRCNAVFPGLIMSDIHKPIIQQTPDQHKLLVASIPMARMGVPDDIAAGILFFASDESRYVTGAELVIDGGFTVQ